MADALAKIRAGVDKARSKLAAQRLGGREWDVQVIPMVAGDAALGLEDQEGAPIVLSPRPAVRFKATYRMTEDGLIQVGDAVVSGISRSYTLDDLKGPPGGMPRKWRIDGRTYRFVDLESRPTEHVVILRREGET